MALRRLTPLRTNTAPPLGALAHGQAVRDDPALEDPAELHAPQPPPVGHRDFADGVSGHRPPLAPLPAGPRDSGEHPGGHRPNPAPPVPRHIRRAVLVRRRLRQVPPTLAG